MPVAWNSADPRAPTVIMGDTIQFVATVHDKTGNVVRVHELQWLYSDMPAAAIDGKTASAIVDSSLCAMPTASTPGTI